MTNPFEIIDARLSNIENLLLGIKHLDRTTITEQHKDCWLGVEDLQKYIPDRPAKQTIYGWVNARSIPYHKGARKLRFLKSEIDQWLKDGRKNICADAATRVIAHLKEKGGCHA